MNEKEIKKTVEQLKFESDYNKSKLGSWINVLFSVIVFVLCGFTVMYLYNSIIPSMFGVRTINFIEALMFDLFVSFIVTVYPRTEKRTKVQKLENTINVMAFTIWILFLGVILNLFL